MLAAFFAVWLGGAARAAGGAPERLAAGVNVVGGQVDYDVTPRVRGELRFVTGSQGGASGTVTSSVFGARAYRLFGASATRFYCGAELAYVKARQSGSSYRVSGPAGGAFVGAERMLARRVALGVDAGPYFFSLRESETRAAETTFDFVLNSYVLFSLF